MTETINKQLGTVQDLATGRDKVPQNRGGVDLLLDPIDIPVVVPTVAALQALDVTLFTRARLYYEVSGIPFTLDFMYDPSQTDVGFPSTAAGGAWVTMFTPLVALTVGDVVAEDLPVGLFLNLQGRDNTVDGGTATWIVAANGSFPPNDVNVLAMTNGNVLLLLNSDAIVNAEVVGVTTDNSAAVNSTRFELVVDFDFTIAFGAGTYQFSTWRIDQNESPVKIIGAGASKTFIEQEVGNSSNFVEVSGTPASPAAQVNWSGFTLRGSAANSNTVLAMTDVAFGNSGLANVVIEVLHKDGDGLHLANCADLQMNLVEVEGPYVDGDETTFNGRGVYISGDFSTGGISQANLANVTVRGFVRGWQLGSVEEAAVSAVTQLALNSCRAEDCGTGWVLGGLSGSSFINCASIRSFLNGLSCGITTDHAPNSCVFVNWFSSSNSRKDALQFGVYVVRGGGLTFIQGLYGNSKGHEIFVGDIEPGKLQDIKFIQPGFLPLTPGSGVAMNIGSANGEVYIDSPIYGAQFGFGISGTHDGTYPAYVNGTIDMVGAIPTIKLNQTRFNVNNPGAVNMTDIIDDFAAVSTTTELYNGYQVSLRFENGNTTLKDVSTGGQFRLVGGADFTPTAADRITLEYYNQEWQEVARSVLA